MGFPLFQEISSLSKKSLSENTDPVMIAFDYTHEDFYGDRNTLWIHGWTGDHGITGKFSFLTTSIVNSDLKSPPSLTSHTYNILIQIYKPILYCAKLNWG